jgi:polyribonucleotide nucleotidyltransferase
MKLYTYIVFCFLSVVCNAQDSIRIKPLYPVMTAEDAVAMALKNNYDIKLSANDLKIDSIIFKPQVGETYSVKVIKMLDFGAVVEYLDAPGNEVLLHVSELAWERTENVSDVVNMGDVFDVKYIGIDPKTRKEKVSRKALLPRPPRDENAPQREDRGFRDDRGPRDFNRGGGRDNRGNSRDDRNSRDRAPREERRNDDAPGNENKGEEPNES